MGAPTLDDRAREDALAGLDELDRPLRPRVDGARRAWAATWPKVAAAALLLGVWQLVVWSGWRPPYVLPGPVPVLRRFAEDLGNGELLAALAITLRRAAIGFALSIAIGSAVGVAVSSSRVLRAAVGSAITAIQTMPSIAWFPLAILLFGLTGPGGERTILFVVVLGAAPSIANGVIAGVDHIPPLLLRAGRSLGARGLTRLRYVVLPAAAPGYVTGLKQGWAFAWRSLMAGELLVIIANRQSLGVRLEFARQFADSVGLLSGMLAIFLVGVLVDALVFSRLELAVRRRWGLTAG